MMKSKIFFIILLNSILSFSQSKGSNIELTFNLQNIKSVKQFKDKKLLNIREYNNDGKLIFSYYKEYVAENWNDKYITIIRAFIYKNRITKSYFLHSNASLNIDYYQYDTESYSENIYSKSNDYEDYDSLVNTNPYYYISEINSFTDLINNSKIDDIEKLSDKHLQSKIKYDSIGNLISEITFEKSGIEYKKEYNVFDEENNLINSTIEYSNQQKWQNYYTYSNKKVIKTVRVEYDDTQKDKEISTVILYKYSKSNNLIEETSYRYGQFEFKKTYFYDKLNRVEKQNTYLINSDKPTIIEKFYYNKEGSIIKEIIKDFRTNEKIKNDYKYIYEYHN